MIYIITYSLCRVFFFLEPFRYHEEKFLICFPLKIYFFFEEIYLHKSVTTEVDFELHFEINKLSSHLHYVYLQFLTSFYFPSNS